MLPVGTAVPSLASSSWMKSTTRTLVPFVTQQIFCLMDDDSQLIEVTRWNFVLVDDGIGGLPPEAWIEMFMTPLASLGGKRVTDVLREQLGFGPID